MKPIVNYENYQIDEFGNVFNKFGKQIKPFRNTCHKGYLKVTLSKNNKSKHFLVHRLVAQHYLEDFSKELQVDHIQDCLNNHYTNLQMLTAKENNSLASQREWESGGNQKYSDDLVLRAIELSKTLKSDKVGQLLGISGRTVRRYRKLESRYFVGSGKVQRLS